MFHADSKFALEELSLSHAYLNKEVLLFDSIHKVIQVLLSSACLQARCLKTAETDLLSQVFIPVQKDKYVSVISSVSSGHKAVTSASQLVLTVVC